MEKTVVIGGNEYRMRASALIPRLYRFKFGRDVISDMNTLRKALRKAQDVAQKADATEDEIRDAQLGVIDLTIFENIAWLLCKHADGTIPDTPDEWLESIDGVFPVYEALPAIIELWDAGASQTSAPAKK